MSDRRHLVLTEDYNGSAIAFRGDAWVNATQMAKPFNKRPLHFLQLPSTKEFMVALAKDLGVMTENPSSLFETVKGNHADGRAQGTWMHPDLALEFARWLSPEFAIWTNRVIRRVLAGESVPTADLASSLAALAQAQAETNGLLRCLLTQSLETNDHLRDLKADTRRLGELKQQMSQLERHSSLTRKMVYIALGIGDAPAVSPVSAPPPPAPQSPVSTRPARHHAKWTPEEDARLRAAVAAGASPASLSKTHGRSSWAILSRMTMLGLVVRPVPFPVPA